MKFTSGLGWLKQSRGMGESCHRCPSPSPKATVSPHLGLCYYHIASITWAIPHVGHLSCTILPDLSELTCLLSHFLVPGSALNKRSIRYYFFSMKSLHFIRNSYCIKEAGCVMRAFQLFSQAWGSHILGQRAFHFLSNHPMQWLYT